MALIILIVLFIVLLIFKAVLGSCETEIDGFIEPYKESIDECNAKIKDLKLNNGNYNKDEVLKSSIRTEIEDYNYEIRRCEGKISERQEDKIRIKKLRLIGNIVFAILAIIITIVNSFYSINEQNIAVVTTFGKPAMVSETGIHFKIPYIQKVEKLDSTIKGFAIGYHEESNSTEANDSLMITSDFNFVNVDFYVEYRINNPIDYLYGSSDPEGILKNIAQASIRNTIGMYPVDSVLTTGKSEIQSVIKEDIMKELENNHTGLMLINITIQDAEPPTQQVSEAFKSVETAKQSAETRMNEAEKYKNEKLPAAQAEADAIEKEAKATKQERIDSAKGEVARFNAMYEEYAKDPNISKVRIYYEAMEELMPNLQIIINGSDSTPVIIQEKAAQEVE